MSIHLLDPTAKLGYLETIGRVSSLPRETEIWWVADQGRIYLMSGGGLDKDWVKNLQQTPHVRFRVGTHWVSGVAAVVDVPGMERRARELMAEKYYGYTPGQDDDLPNEWTKTAVPVVITIATA